MRDAGASFTVEVTPHDELIPQIESIKELVYREVGAWLVSKTKPVKGPVAKIVKSYTMPDGQYGAKLQVLSC